MSVTPDQQKALDNFAKAFNALVDALGPAVAVKHAAVVAAAGPGAVVPGPGVTLPPPGPRTDWWNPTPAETLQFAMDMGIQPEQLIPWTFTPKGEIVKASTNSFPLLPAISDVPTAKRYAAFGYGPDGRQILQTDVGFKQARTMADRVAASDKPGDILKGSEYADNDTVAFGCCTGFVDFNVPAPAFGGGVDIPALITTYYKKSTRKSGDPGASGL